MRQCGYYRAHNGQFTTRVRVVINVIKSSLWVALMLSPWYLIGYLFF